MLEIKITKTIITGSTLGKSPLKKLQNSKSTMSDHKSYQKPTNMSSERTRLKCYKITTRHHRLKAISASAYRHNAVICMQWCNSVKRYL